MFSRLQIGSIQAFDSAQSVKALQKLAAGFAAVLLLTSCQQVSVPRVSSSVGNVEEVCTDFVTHYLDNDAKTYETSQKVLRQVASPGCIQSMQRAGVLAKNLKELKARVIKFSKNKTPDTVDVKQVTQGDVTANGLIPVTVTGEVRKAAGKTVSFAYKLLLGVRKDNGKLAVVTITKQ